MRIYERLPGSSDRPRVRVFGYTRYELFENAGYAMYDLAYDLDTIASTYSRPVVAPGDGYEELLANWLGELRAVGAEEGIVWSYFTVDRLEPGGVQGSAGGMPQEQVTGTAAPISALLSPPSIVRIPDGWWVDLEFERRPRLGPA